MLKCDQNELGLDMDLYAGMLNTDAMTILGIDIEIWRNAYLDGGEIEVYPDWRQVAEISIERYGLFGVNGPVSYYLGEQSIRRNTNGAAFYPKLVIDPSLTEQITVSLPGRRTCEVCGAELEPMVRRDARYCSNKCRQRAKRQRQKEAQRG